MMNLLRTEPGHLQRLLNSLPMGILGLDNDGTCALINELAADTLGLERPLPIGKPILKLIQNRPLQNFIRNALNTSTSDRPYTCEVPSHNAVRSIRVTVVREQNITDGDHVVVLFEDLRVERETSRKRDEFLALVSHELRTPLTVIKGYLELMNNGTMGTLNKQQEEAIVVMHDHCLQLETHIRDLIRFGMMTRGEANVTSEPVALLPFLKAFGRSMKTRLQSAGSNLSLTLPDPDTACACDREYLTDLLRHLVDNSIKFSDRGINIEVQATRFDVKLLPPPDNRIIKTISPNIQAWIKIAVIDNGPGIPADRIHDIFNSFEQVENYMTRKTRGLGLGLAFVKEVVKAYGGTLWIESGETGGTTVSVILPQAQLKKM